MEDYVKELIGALLALLLMEVVLLAIAREFILRYFMIRRGIRALESIAASLECMPAVQEKRRSEAGRRRIA